MILAHRGNLHGPDKARENSYDSCAQAMAAGFGLEIDLRRDAEKRWYVSHDYAPWRSEISLGRFEPLFRQWPEQPIAVNVKELDSVAELAALVGSGVFGRRAFLFDFELCEPKTPGRSQVALRRSEATSAAPLASRISDRNEPIEQCLAIPAEHVWADEFDREWLEASHVERVRGAGRRVWAVSPDLHNHGLPEAKARWAAFAAWGVDGVCTDFAVEAVKFFCK
jgi:glycerophosphoryl diester phosphodiesterase